LEVGVERTVALSELAVGDRLRLRHGELVPADGRIVRGDALIDYSFVTGESEPVQRQAGDLLYAGGQQVGGTMELEIVMEAPMAEEFGVKVLCGKDGSKGFTIASGKGNKTLRVGYINPPFELKKGKDLTLRIFIDKNMIEVFANDRQAAVAWHEYDPKDLHVSLFSKGGDVKCKTISSWKMNSIYAETAAGL